MRRAVVIGALVLAAGASIAAPAIGHGILEGAAPSPNAVLAAPPRQITIAFTERADPSFTSVAVTDRQGRRVSGTARVSADGRRVTAALQPLARGTYAVRWRMLSAVDGHTTTGTYLFRVASAGGSPPSPPPQIEPQPPEAAAGTEAAPLSQVIFRWASYAAALLLAGTAFFAYFIVRPILTAAEPHIAVAVEDAVPSSIRPLSLAAAAALIVSVLAGLAIQVQTLLDVPLAGVFTGGQWKVLLTGTRLGWSSALLVLMGAIFLIPDTRRGRVFRMAAVIWSVVLGTLALLAGNPEAVSAGQHLLHLTVLLLIGTVYSVISVIAAVILPLIPDLRLPQAKWAAPAAGAILLAGMTLNAHAAGTGWIAVAADWLHLAGAAIWIGALAGLLMTLRSVPADLRSSATRLLVPRFSTFAAFSLLVLVITGAYAAWLNLPDWQAFSVTPYGRTLLVKLFIIAPWVVLGAFNHFILRPRLARRADQTLLARFARLIGAEIALAGAVLFTVAALTITPPARVTMPAADSGLLLNGIDGHVRIGLSVRPARTGWNAYSVTVDRPSGSLAIRGVRLRFVPLSTSASPVAITLAPRAGEFVGEGPELAGGGWWRIDVAVPRAAAADTIVEFPVYLGGGAPLPQTDEAPRALAAALERSHTIRSWRQTDQISDGRGNVVVTRYAFSRPDRVQYWISAGGEAVIIGATRYVREDGTWRREAQARPLTLNGPFVEYIRGAEHVALGRRESCGREACRVVLWEIPAARARFAAWIGESSHVIYRVLMVAPGHYMTAAASAFNAPLTIEPPR